MTSAAAASLRRRFDFPRVIPFLESVGFWLVWNKNPNTQVWPWNVPRKVKERGIFLFFYFFKKPTPSELIKDSFGKAESSSEKLKAAFVATVVQRQIQPHWSETNQKQRHSVICKIALIFLSYKYHHTFYVKLTDLHISFSSDLRHFCFFCWAVIEFICLVFLFSLLFFCRWHALICCFSSHWTVSQLSMKLPGWRSSV